jgi:RHH-type transcriptional regulator, proline utilization regulon repressor / proline dehydrogenase / delta 1-pyrroline-5-carboxylate dehydrogenase
MHTMSMISSEPLNSGSERFFKNEPLTDFALPECRAALEAALTRVDRRVGKLYACPIIGGKEMRGEERVEREDPSRTEVVLGEVWYAGERAARDTLELLRREGGAWSDTPYSERAAIIERAGHLMRERRHDLSALIIREAGKPWREADADVAEAIDFCLYYAAEMRRLGPPLPTSDVPGEENYYLYQPRGIAAVIAPWNFPLAIPCGMTVAALVTGNPTILKPAEQTSLIAFEFARILFDAGVPPSAFALLPGRGETIGKLLVEDPRVAIICFTGSKQVGLQIVRTAADVPEGQEIIKKVIAELGGKNAIIVDDDADFDEAIKGVLYSSFGYAGQKCSACSRVIVVEQAYEAFVRRLSEAAEDMIIGEARDPATLVGPVIDKDSQMRITRTIEEGERSLQVGFKGKVPDHGYYVPPTIFKNVPPDATMWREEIFGPVICARSARTFEEAIEIANGSHYALTGAVFSRNPEHLDHARRRFRVGNLYINRGSTGAIVGRQPFGGFKLSGIGSKAGGPDYLLQFMEPRVITENTVRRGFAPEG